MRLPFGISLESRDGTLSKDQGLKNALLEINPDRSFLVKRPGVENGFSGIPAGSIGQGIVGFGGNLYAISDDTLYIGTDGIALNNVWSSVASYLTGDFVSYDGALWEAVQNNSGQEPSFTNTTYWTQVNTEGESIPTFNGISVIFDPDGEPQSGDGSWFPGGIYNFYAALYSQTTGYVGEPTLISSLNTGAFGQGAVKATFSSPPVGYNPVIYAEKGGNVLRRILNPFLTYPHIRWFLYFDISNDGFDFDLPAFPDPDLSPGGIPPPNSIAL